ncbi:MULTISPECIES: hypothetical protein [Cellulosimicrobium]|uniref:hypothetical protein n=1 Tax=Cellulosimicrobium TaxID=157920 RepID=UPI001BA5E9C3|nr:hypothetical protein [Cellulosimicrobium cellulans]QUC01984.1 hypothetical protein J5A69_19565 [Cellulosimicrobium cellulans]
MSIPPDQRPADSYSNVAIVLLALSLLGFGGPTQAPDLAQCLSPITGSQSSTVGTEAGGEQP